MLRLSSVMVRLSAAAAKAYRKKTAPRMAFVIRGVFASAAGRLPLAAA
jgi:hypothetical protein